MYTILMNQDKSLTTSLRTTIYQGENLADSIQFLFPEYYETVNLSECVAVLKYIDQANIFHSEILARDSELYKGKVRCLLPVDSKLTQFAGNISVKISFVKIGDDSTLQELLKTGSTIITVLQDEAVVYPANIPEKMAVLQTKVNENTALIEELKATKGDSIFYNLETHELNLKANNELISSAMLEDCECEDGVPIVNFNGLEDTPNNSEQNEVDNTVQF